jgi:hypothetical protein
MAMPSAPDWAKNPTRPVPGQDRRDRGVQADLGVGVDQAEGVRSHDPHPVGARVLHEPALPLPALLAGLAEPGGEHDQAVRPLAGAVRDHGFDAVGGHRDDHELDRSRHVDDPDVPRDAVHRRPGAVHHGQRAGEPGRHQVGEDQPPERVRRTTGPDDHDRRRAQQPLDRACLGAVLPRLHDRERGLGRREVEGQRHDAVVEAA